MTDAPFMERAEFERIADALRGTPIGRAFLREHARASQVLAAARIDEMFGELKQMLSEKAPQGGQFGVMRMELKDLAEHIQKTRSEIAALRPKDVSANRIMAASEELDAIVMATERATGEILNAAEQITAQCAEQGAYGDIEMLAVEIMTACSFQDITGQRISKVVNTLRYIEQRVASMIQMWGDDASGRTLDLDQEVYKLDDQRPDAHLMHGPAVKGGMQQDDIDQLLSSFDAVASEGKASAAE